MRLGDGLRELRSNARIKWLVWGVFVSELAPNGFLGVKISSTALLRLARPWKTGRGWWRRNSTGSVSARTPWRVEPYWRYLDGRKVQGRCTGSSVATQLQSSGVPSPKIEVHVRSSVRSTSMLSRSMSLEETYARRFLQKRTVVRRAASKPSRHSATADSPVKSAIRDLHHHLVSRCDKARPHYNPAPGDWPLLPKRK